MPVLPALNFHLQHTLESGQFFLYEKRGNWYYLFTQGKAFKLRQHGNEMEYRGVDKTFLAHFLGLDEDYEAMVRSLRKDAVLRQAVEE